MRWLSHASVHGDDASALLEALTDGVAAADAPLRELCARGCAEFVRYAIKQSTGAQLGRGAAARGDAVGGSGAGGASVGALSVDELLARFGARSPRAPPDTPHSRG